MSVAVVDEAGGDCVRRLDEVVGFGFAVVEAVGEEVTDVFCLLGVCGCYDVCNVNEGFGVGGEDVSLDSVYFEGCKFRGAELEDCMAVAGGLRSGGMWQWFEALWLCVGEVGGDVCVLGKCGGIEDGGGCWVGPDVGDFGGVVEECFAEDACRIEVCDCAVVEVDGAVFDV